MVMSELESGCFIGSANNKYNDITSRFYACYRDITDKNTLEFG